MQILPEVQTIIIRSIINVSIGIHFFRSKFFYTSSQNEQIKNPDIDKIN